MDWDIGHMIHEQQKHQGWGVLWKNPLMGKIRNIFAVHVGRYSNSAPVRRRAFLEAKNIWNEATQSLKSI